MTLYSYTIPVDDGAAPNPFYGMCSLAICKPGIRRTARLGDWVVGLGSKKNQQRRDLSGTVVYAMRVDEKVSLQEYDQLAPTRWPHRIPDFGDRDLNRKLGDCLYDYSSGSPVQRRGVHRESNKATDLSGQSVLISFHFFYFGDEPIKLPEGLRPIIHQTQGHKSNSNAPYAVAFVTWLTGLQLEPGRLYGKPAHIIRWNGDPCPSCSTRRKANECDPAY